MDVSHFGQAELSKHHKGTVVLWEDDVKNDDGYRAVFTEKWRISFEKPRTRVSTILGIAEDANDAVSAYTPRVPKLLETNAHMHVCI